ncbi:MAG: BON domain-containing protein [Moraxella sp.]|nr:BON domain-containing protein [Moraxella sp.]
MKTFSVMMAVLTACGMMTACTTTSTTSTHQANAVSNRTLTERVTDESIEFAITRNLPNVAGLDGANSRMVARVMADSFRGEVLLTGEVPSETAKINVENMVKSMKNVSQVHNYLTVASVPKSPSHTTHENFLKSKIRAKLLTNQTVINPQYKLALRSDVVYLMGHVNSAQQSNIIQAVTSTMGIQKLVLLGTLLDDSVALGSDDGQSELSADNKAPIVRMEDAPISDYVRLHNNTTNP